VTMTLADHRQVLGARKSGGDVIGIAPESGKFSRG
jgi:hypothetical protein